MIVISKLLRKIDNTAKVFSLEEKKYKNIFRLTIDLKETVDPLLLKEAIIQSLETYPGYKVKLKAGIFWHYLQNNTKEPIVEKGDSLLSKWNTFKQNNEYLFKVTYLDKKINLDIYHVLTDGVGASLFLKSILYNYLNFKYGLRITAQETILPADFAQDAYLKNADKKIKNPQHDKKAFLLKGKVDLTKDKIYHFILDLDECKSLCKKHNVSITEYLTALYIYAIYKTFNEKITRRDIAITVPIDLRKHYQVRSFSNFFTCMNIKADILNKNILSFKEVLKNVHQEFKSKLTIDNIKRYLARDVKLGTNIGIRMVPLQIKQMYMKYMSRAVNSNTTTTLSNIGIFDIEEQYEKYVDNMLASASTGKYQKAKCTVCSYQNKLNITLNTSLISSRLENVFYELLLTYFSNVGVESNVL